MNEEHADLAAAGLADLKARAQAAGLDWLTILGLVKEFGPVVLTILERLLAR